MIRLGHSKQSISLKMTMLSLLAVGLLAGCGIRGSLKTPPPLFGSESKVDPERVPDTDLDREDTSEDDDDDDWLIDDPLADI